jgi:hypothetical protein
MMVDNCLKPCNGVFVSPLRKTGLRQDLQGQHLVRMDLKDLKGELLRQSRLSLP